MVRHKALNRHWCPSAMVVGHNFGRMTEASNNAGGFPFIAQVFLNHNPDIEFAFLMLEQLNSFLDDVRPGLLLCANA
ncbi:hypothetical protein D3C86_2175730 [compost metagenome]